MRDQRGELRRGRHDPAERQRQQSADGAEQREVEHDRRGRLGIGEPARLHHRGRAGEGAGEREQRAERRRRGGGTGVAREIEMRPQHHDHAGEADHDRAPAIDAHALLEEQGGERDRDQRRHEADGGHVHDRQPRERREAEEHAAGGDQPAAEMAERARGAQRRGELAPPRIDHHHRNDREGRAEEHDLPDRNRVADIAHHRRHHREQERRDELEQDGLEDIHRRIRPAPRVMLPDARPTGTVLGSRYFFSGRFGPSTGGSDLM